jgi:single-strand DNA-binding protein
VSDPKNKKGEWEDSSFVLNVFAWGKTAELAQQNLSKGDSIFIDGRLKLDHWEDEANGEIHQKLRIVAHRIDFLGPNPHASHENGERVDE